VIQGISEKSQYNGLEVVVKEALEFDKYKVAVVSELRGAPLLFRYSSTSDILVPNARQVQSGSLSELRGAPLLLRYSST
jgi:hypothetical protein